MCASSRRNATRSLRSRASARRGSTPGEHQFCARVQVTFEPAARHARERHVCERRTGSQSDDQNGHKPKGLAHGTSVEQIFVGYPKKSIATLLRWNSRTSVSSAIVSSPPSWNALARSSSAACPASTRSPSSAACSTSPTAVPFASRRPTAAPAYSATSTTPTCSRRASADTDGSFRVLDFAPRFQQFDRMFRPTKIVRIVEPLSGTPQIQRALRSAPRLVEEGARRAMRARTTCRYRGLPDRAAADDRCTALLRGRAAVRAHQPQAPGARLGRARAGIAAAAVPSLSRTRPCATGSAG